MFPSQKKYTLDLLDRLEMTNANPVATLMASLTQIKLKDGSNLAKYRALANSSSAVLWLKNLLHELHVKLNWTPKLLCDNIQATYLCANPVYHSRVKYLVLDYHFLRRKVQWNEIQVTYVTFKHQLADWLTKPLTRKRFEVIRSKTWVDNGSPVLWGILRVRIKGYQI